MPTYDYRCASCGHTFEEFQPMSAKPLTECPSCGKHSLRKVLGSGAGMIFKGQGFYLTDYKNTGGKKIPDAGAKTPSPEKGSPEKTPAKTEPTPKTP